MIIGAEGKLGSRLRAALEKRPEICEVIPITHTPDRVKTVSALIANIDAGIDVSKKGGIFEYLDLFCTFKKPLVIASTGFSPEETHKLEQAGHLIPLVRSANFSQGITYFRTLLPSLARLPVRKVVLSESHADTKIDTPSGTLLELHRAFPHAEVVVFRTPHFTAEHTITLHLGNETVTLKHEAHSRDAFVDGIVEALFSICNNHSRTYNCP